MISESLRSNVSREHVGPGEIDPQQEFRVAEFQERLNFIDIKPLTVDVDISASDPSKSASQEFFTSDFRQNSTFYIAPEVAELMDTNQLTGFVPYRSRAGQQSRHGVFFGALMLQSGAELPIAVKPFQATDASYIREMEGDCLKDYFTNIAAAKGGFEGLEPVGFIMGDDRQPYSITLLNNTLNSLENANWKDFYKPGFETTGMRNQLSRAAMMTALLHSTGISSDRKTTSDEKTTGSFHGDLAFRNIAEDIDGRMIFLDWEYGKVSTHPSANGDHFEHALTDLKTFMQDALDVGLFDLCENDRWDEFKNLYLDEYKEWRLALASQGSHHMTRVKKTDAELAQLETVLHEQMLAMH